jgi:TPR repeat protein
MNHSRRRVAATVARRVVVVHKRARDAIPTHRTETLRTGIPARSLQRAACRRKTTMTPARHPSRAEALPFAADSSPSVREIVKLARSLKLSAYLLVAAATAVHADYDRAVAAVKRGDANAAFKEFLSAAERGDERAFVQVARAYAYGVGTKPDPRAAQGWATKAAAKGSADGQFLVYALVISRPELNFLDRKGQIDAQRYSALAKRPISEREDEMAAYDMLGKAAGQGHHDAMISLAGFYADNVGEGNRARAEALIDKFRQRPPTFDGLRKRLGELDALGPTLVTVRLADEAVPAAAKVAQAAAAEKDQSKGECNAAKLVRAQRMGPVNRPIWLPLAVPELKTAYLMSGEWRERWTFDVCGAESVVHVRFIADGLGSATHAAEKER